MHADFRLGLRALRREPLISLAALLTLALGMTANTAVFALVYSILGQPLPFEEPETLVRVYGVDLELGEPTRSIFPPAFHGLAEHPEPATGLAAIVAGAGMHFSMRTSQGGVVEVPGAVVSASLFSLLGVEAAVGRVFYSDEDRAGSDAVALLGYRLWRTHFGGDPSVLGESILLNDQPFTVIGVIPEQLEFPMGAEVWVPNPDRAPEVRNLAVPIYSYFEVIARLEPGADLDAAGEMLNARYRSIVDLYPDVQTSERIRLVPLGEDLARGPAQSLKLLQIAATAVLLMACGNISGLLLVRSFRRRGEFAVRAILGARPARLVRQVICENLVLFLVGGLVGLIAAGAVLGALTAGAPAEWLHHREIGLDLTTVLFTVMVALACGLGFGSLPALGLLRSNLVRPVTEGLAPGGSSRQRLGEVIIVGEIALAIALLVSAGLLIRSVLHLQAQPLGFSPERVFSVKVSVQESRYPSREARMELLERIRASLEFLPGVERVGGSQFFFLTEGSYQNVVTASRSSSEDSRAQIPVLAALVTPGYFQALGLPIEIGRGLSEERMTRRDPEAVISRSLARALWQETDVLGRQIEFEGRWWTVVGVTGELLTPGPRPAPGPSLFLPYELAMLAPGQMTFLVRSTTLSPHQLAEGVRQRVSEIDPLQTIGAVQSLRELVARRSAAQRYAMRLISVFAGTAMTLAAVGIYSLLAYGVVIRRRELGIRMALGATPGRARWEVVSRGLLLGLAALVLGGVLATAAGRALRNLLYGVDAWDPLSWGLALLGGLGVFFASTWIPMRRAARVDPSVILREV